MQVSGLTGENLVQSSAEELVAWYQGSTLLEAIDALEPPSRRIDVCTYSDTMTIPLNLLCMQAPLRLSITDLFKSDVRSQLGSSCAGRVWCICERVGWVELNDPDGLRNSARW